MRLSPEAAHGCSSLKGNQKHRVKLAVGQEHQQLQRQQQEEHSIISPYAFYSDQRKIPPHHISAL